MNNISSTSSISIEEVFIAYYECRKNKRRTFNALSFESDYEANCVQLWRELNDGTYKIGKSIAFIVTRPVLREVFAADFRDRIVHHIVMHRLEPLFEKVFIQDNYNCRKGKGTLFGIQRFYDQTKEMSENYSRDYYIVKCDLKGFFMSIHKPTLWIRLKKFIIEEYKGEDIEILLRLVKQIVLHCPELNCIRKSSPRLWKRLPNDKSLFTSGRNYGLPIGNLTSQMFANFYLHLFDKWMEGKHKDYGRYVDDFHFGGYDKNELLKEIVIIRKFLLDNFRVTLHPKKLYVQHYLKGCQFIGAVIKGERLYVGNRTKSNFINKVRFFNKLLEWEPEYIEENAEYLVSCMNSYLGFLRKYESYAIRRKIISMLDERWWKVIYIEGHFEKMVCRKKFKERNKIKMKVKENIYCCRYSNMRCQIEI